MSNETLKRLATRLPDWAVIDCVEEIIGLSPARFESLKKFCMLSKERFANFGSFIECCELIREQIDDYDIGILANIALIYREIEEYID